MNILNAPKISFKKSSPSKIFHLENMNFSLDESSDDDFSSSQVVFQMNDFDYFINPNLDFRPTWIGNKKNSYGSFR